jgi:type VI secretion system protein ImpL
MMQRFWQFLSNRTTLMVLGGLAFTAFLFLAAALFQISTIWVFAVLAVVATAALAAWWLRRRKHQEAAASFGGMLDQQVQATGKSEGVARQENEAIRKRMVEAIGTIKTSKLGQLSGDAALYELPWYMVIGNPAAGKSTAIANSGLQFPFADSKIIQGVGGTRNCDWFFTTDGILLDTAGRYSVVEDDRGEWFGFLALLKKHRKRAPINGIIIAVSVAELTGNRPEFAINLAKNLRQRVQELTEKLEVHAPVYVMFTKADLISGFNEFFWQAERSERDKVWGATLPYQPTAKQNVLEFFDARFDELYDGLKELSLANMSINRSEALAPGVFTFPLEFSSIKAPLRSFIAALFEENPFQFKPVFRGFYFTSALQEGESVSASSERVARRFDLKARHETPIEVNNQEGFFLLNLFRQVIFADRDLVAQYASASKMRNRYITFFAATALVGLALGAWSWSYVSNRQLVANVQADLDQAIKLQDKKVDLASRFEALEVIQDRIEQLDSFKKSRPLQLGLGLYQGDLLERKLREEYFSGVKEVMLKPVGQTLEAFLTEMNNNAAQLQAISVTPGSTPAAVPANANGATVNNTAAPQFKDASPTNVEDGYNALKTYLMLTDKSHAEASHLNDQLSRFWRVWLDGNRGNMPREQMIRSAERMIAFYLSQINDPSWPAIDSKLALVDQSRDSLRRVVRGMPARDRVYADIKARSATRYAPMTVAGIVGEQDKELMLGSYAVPGTFTREAWDGYIQGAIKDAANRELQSTDWVLKTAAKDDLTLEGSPEQIQKALIELYKSDYAKQWQKFIQGVRIKDLGNFDVAAAAMNRLGDPQISPMQKLMTTIYEQTSWDNPSLVGAGLQRAQTGIMGWFKETILRQKPSQVNLTLNTAPAAGAPPMGAVGRAFAGVARLIITKDQNASLMGGYMQALSKLRGRFNTIKNQGDTGPGAKQFMQQTLDGNGSELADALKFVDEQMLTGMGDEQKQAIRPILVRPLMQSFAVIVKPTELEINKTWTAQVYEPFQKNLAPKYPFSGSSKVEASGADIATLFGPEGGIAKFFTTSVGPLVVRRGDELSARTWAGMGLTLLPSVTSRFPAWVAPLSANGVAAPGAVAAVAPTEPQTMFDLSPLATPTATEYTIEIDGQQLRWKGQPQGWSHMAWPNPQGTPGVRITAQTLDGRTVVLLNEPGNLGLKKMIGAAKRKKRDNGVFELSWENSGITVSANLKIVATPPAPAATTAGAASAATASKGFRGMSLPPAVAGGPDPAAAAAAPLAANDTPAAVPAAAAAPVVTAATTGARP